MSTTCILCHQKSFTKKFKKGDWDIVQCDGCGLQFVNPLPTEKAIDDFYNEHKQSTQERIDLYLKTRASRDRRDIRKLKLLEKVLGGRGKILDIGCGMGLFVKNAADRGWQAKGIDLDHDMVEYGKKTFSVDLSSSMLGDLPASSFDVITMFNVVDHLQTPLDFLNEVSRVLKPNGIVYTNLHDAGGWKAKKYSQDWGAYCPPMHLYYYTPKTLEMMVNKAGLKVLMVPGINLKEGIKVILVKKDNARQVTILRKTFEKCVYDCVQMFKL